MTRDGELKEIIEAIQAGERTLFYLEGAQSELASASNWGIADMLGLDMFGGIGKHMKVKAAKEKMEQAKVEIQSFQKELSDVHQNLNFTVNISEFLTFADFFFDGLIADWMVQSRIGDAKKQVDSAVFKVKSIIADLQRMKQGLE